MKRTAQQAFSSKVARIQAQGQGQDAALPETRLVLELHAVRESVLVDVRAAPASVPVPLPVPRQRGPRERELARIVLVLIHRGKRQPGAHRIVRGLSRLVDTLGAIPSALLVNHSVDAKWAAEDTWMFAPHAYAAVRAALVSSVLELGGRPLQLVAAVPTNQTTLPFRAATAATLTEAEAVKRRNLAETSVEGLPAQTLSILARPRNAWPTDEEMAQALTLVLWQSLFPFQREGVKFGVSTAAGRVLVADEMGLGKTRQGMCIAAYFAHREPERSWPWLILCPSLLKGNWRHELLDVLPHLLGGDADVQIIRKGTDTLQAGAKVVILSYSMNNHALFQHLLNSPAFGTVILDECHYIKSPDSTRTTTALRLCGRANFRILLSGTPMSRPREIWTQLKAVDESLFPGEFWNHRGGNGMAPLYPFHFSNRYCDPKKQRVSANRMITVHNGCTRPWELNALLQDRIMIRRRKADVLPDLPPKVRERVILDELGERDLLEFKTQLDKIEVLRDERGTAASDPAFMELFRKTAAMKQDMVVEYLKEVVMPYLEENDEAKVILFGHHQTMLDAAQTTIEASKIGFMRIDGKTPDARRNDHVQSFQTDPAVRVALLSITAAGVGITLTRAALVIMMELLFNPKDPFQAEDRAHRIGQTETVIIRYLILKGSTDDCLWNMISSKTRTTGLVLDNRPEWIHAPERKIE